MEYSQRCRAKVRSLESVPWGAGFKKIILRGDQRGSIHKECKRIATQRSESQGLSPVTPDALPRGYGYCISYIDYVSHVI